MQIQFESNGPHGEMFIPLPSSKRQDSASDEETLDASEPIEDEKSQPDSVQ